VLRADYVDLSVVDRSNFYYTNEVTLTSYTRTPSLLIDRQVTALLSDAHISETDLTIVRLID